MIDHDLDIFLDDLFLGCAFAAYVELAAEQQRAPDSEATKRLAYRKYEEALAEKPVRNGTTAMSTATRSGTSLPAKASAASKPRLSRAAEDS